MRSTTTSSDDSLLQQWRAGSQEAAQTLYDRYRPRLQALVQSRLSAEVGERLDAEDIVQSVFRRFFLSVTEKEYEIPEGEELWGLFLVIAMNRIRTEETFQRAHRRDVRRTVHLEMIHLVTGRGASQTEETSHLLHVTIEEFLHQLPDQQRTMVEMRIEGHTVAEIAQHARRSHRSVERCLQEVRRQLRNRLLLEENA